MLWIYIPIWANRVCDNQQLCIVYATNIKRFISKISHQERVHFASPQEFGAITSDMPRSDCKLPIIISTLILLVHNLSICRFTESSITNMLYLFWFVQILQSLISCGKQPLLSRMFIADDNSIQLIINHGSKGLMHRKKKFYYFFVHS